MTPNAPGQSHRKGISIIELFSMFPDDAAAEKWFEITRWGANLEGFCCPRCGSMDKVSAVPSGKPMPYWCGDCRRNFSVRIGSAMERSKIGYQKWAIAIYMWATSLKGVSSMKLHRELSITQKSAYFMAQRLREAWPRDEGKLHGPVEVDESYFGGKDRNRHARNRSGIRGLSGKTAVVGMKDRTSKQVRVKVVDKTDAATLQGFIVEHADAFATVYTDDAKAYKGLPNHETVKHSIGEYVRGDVHTNGIESLWSMLKRAHKGTFHKISPKHLHRYVQEFALRNNVRGADTIDVMQEIFVGMIGKRLMYKDLIAD